MNLLRRLDRLEREFNQISDDAAAIIVADFLSGGEACFARACSAKGDVIELVRRGEYESQDDFVERARGRAIALGTPRLVVGGFDPGFDADAVPWSPVAPREVITLPDGGGLHRGQARAARVTLDRKRVVLRAGRRWGKSSLLVALAADEALRGRPVGYFSPLFKTAAPVFDALARLFEKRRKVADRPAITPRQRRRAIISVLLPQPAGGVRPFSGQGVTRRPR